MQVDSKKIIETFNRIEEENGGHAFSSAKATLEKTADELGVDIDRARSVMVDYWTMRGAG
jgi:hypothetical protein